jgi:PKD repeat protein
MKNIFLTLLSGLLISLSSFAQNYTLMVNGTVQIVVNNTITPVQDQAVNILIDSTNSGYTYQNTVFTDQTGYYEDIISIPGSFGYGYVFVSTYDSCLGQYQSQGQFFQAGATITSMDFYLCNVPPNPCQAMFYNYPLDPADPYTIQFMNQSSGNYTQVNWSFGDSTFSTEESPIHTFPGPGSYYVCLTISDGMECSNTYCEIVYTGGGSGGCENYFIYNYGPNDPFTLTFEGFLVNGQYAQSYWWDFGDGTTGAGQTVTHTFPTGQGTNGMYMVGLTTYVADSLNDSCFYTSYQEVWVQNQQGCNAYFTYYPDSLNLLTINFLDMSYDSNGFPPNSWSWEFGDGSGSPLQNPVHTYADTGYYTVCLTIADSMGQCTSTYCDDIFTGYTPPPSGCSDYFTYEQNDSTTFAFSGFIYLNNGVIYPDSNSVFSWDFGDGTTGTGQTVTHYFQGNPAGGYTVCLTTTVVLADGTTCTAIYCEGINLGVPSFNIYGYVLLDNNLFADYAVVHLMTLDTTGQNVIEVESVTLDSMGHYSFIDIPMYNTWMYYVQAELTQESQYFGQYLPTYYESALTWEEATPVLPYTQLPANILMIAGTQAGSGIGVISGIVSELGTRGFMSGVEIVLMDPYKNPMVYLRSDDQGSFVFNGLAFGSYIIHAELLGIHTIQAQVTLSADQPEASVEVQVSGDQANIVFGVPEQKSVIDNVGEIYPNPANGNAKLDISVIKPVSLSISIFGQTGQLMDSRDISIGAGSHNLILDTGILPVGLYLVRIITGQGEIVSRRFMKVK